MRPSRNERDRPPGLAPKGTSWGLAIMTLYWSSVPGFTLLALTPFASDTFTWVTRVIFTPLTSLLLIVPFAVGVTSRRYWGVLAYFWLGAIGAVMMGIALVIVASAGVYLLVHPLPLGGFDLLFGVFLLIEAALLPLLLRALRLRYWQPWTTPDQWEIGDERGPKWARAD